jgi:hypothetical protein
VISVFADKPQASGAPPRPTVGVSGKGDRLALTGALGIGTLAEARSLLEQWSSPGSSRTLDIAGLDSLDRAGSARLNTQRPEISGLAAV